MNSTIVDLKTETESHAKLERAERHIYDLQDLWTTFRNETYRWSFKDDEQSGQRIYYLNSMGTFDYHPLIPNTLGDAIHNLRSCLDHLAYRVVSGVSGVTDEVLQHTYFPIAETPKEYKRGPRKRLEDAGKSVPKPFDEIEPYLGGAGEILWFLHYLDIVDKHHLLIPLGSTNRMHSTTPSQIAAIKRDFLGMGLDEFTPAQDAVAFQTAATNIIFPLKPGDILAVIPKSEVNEHMAFTFDIAFGDPVQLRGKPVIPVLWDMAQKVRVIVREFRDRGLLG